MLFSKLSYDLTAPLIILDPALGIAGLGARDIMGYCAIVLIASGIVTALGFLFLVPLLA